MCDPALPAQSFIRFDIVLTVVDAVPSVRALLRMRSVRHSCMPVHLTHAHEFPRKRDIRPRAEMQLNMAKQQRAMAIQQQAASMQAQASQYKCLRHFLSSCDPQSYSDSFEHA